MMGLYYKDVIYHWYYLKKYSYFVLIRNIIFLNLPVFQLLFVIYMGIVAILLVNMLIAMMGNTYQKIAETRNEWQRQVTEARVADRIPLASLVYFQSI